MLQMSSQGCVVLQATNIAMGEEGGISNRPKHTSRREPRLITFDRSVMTYKIMTGLCPENLWKKFQRRSHYSYYNTRFCENPQIPKYHLEHSKKRFSYTALKAWNELPMNIWELPTL